MNEVKWVCGLQNISFCLGCLGTECVFAELLGFMGYDATHIKLRNHMEQKSSLIQLQNRLDMSFKKNR